MFLLKGKVQHYAWGGNQYIPNLLGLSVNNEPHAEYWLGTHKKAPSSAIIHSKKANLEDLILNSPVETLGREVDQRFGRLPFLFKILDVKKMLSIQVHPTKQQAEAGFEAENKKGIALDAPNRNYKDDNHKPEIMVALSDFWLLHGFKPEEQLKTILAKYESFGVLLSIFESGGLKALYEKVMKMTDDEAHQILQPVIGGILPKYRSESLEKSSEEYWAAKAYLEMQLPEDPYDRGIFSIFLFNLVEIKEGNAVFQDAGIPHAYLEGQNVELMANSDNVLRGGLTPKHIDVDELLKLVKYEFTEPKIISGTETDQSTEKKYISPAPDFELSQISLSHNQTYSNKAKTAEILLVLDGETQVSSSNEMINLKQGQAVVTFCGDEYHVVSNSSATIFKATTPSPSF